MSALLVRLVLLIGLVALGTAAGVLIRARAGRARPVSSQPLLTAADLSAPLGAGATFVQFSSPSCQPCRAVRRVLDEVAGELPELAHVEVDASQRLDLARRLHILRTPTVLVLDRNGLVVRRISGLLTPAQARAALPEPLRS